MQMMAIYFLEVGEFSDLPCFVGRILKSSGKPYFSRRFLLVGVIRDDCMSVLFLPLGVVFGVLVDAANALGLRLGISSLTSVSFSRSPLFFRLSRDRKSVV